MNSYLCSNKEQLSIQHHRCSEPESGDCDRHVSMQLSMKRILKDPDGWHCDVPMWSRLLSTTKITHSKQSVNDVQQHVTWTDRGFSDYTNPQGLVWVRILEVQVVFPFFAELWRSNVHSNINLACITSFLNGLFQQLQAYNAINSIILHAVYISMLDDTLYNGCKMVAVVVVYFCKIQPDKSR